MKQAKQRTPAQKELVKPERIEVDQLFLDPRNPRLVREEYAVADQDEIAKKLWAEFNVSEIVDSIVASNDFWEHEPLIAAREDGKLIVIEGNRRLAAVKLLLDPARYKVSGVPSIDDTLREKLRRLPVMNKPRRDVWDFVGFKHVNGPQEWDSIAKAQYISRIHEEYKVELPDIAKAIGDRNATVERLYHGLKVLEQAEKEGVFDRENRYFQKKAFAYSHLWTGLGYEGIRIFLGIKDGSRSKRDPVPREKIPALRDLFRWLYGDGKERAEPLIRSQNPDLRKLDEALRSPRGVSALRKGLPLQVAVNVARGDEALLFEALIAAENNLREAKAYFSTAYRGQEQLINTIKNIVSLADSLGQELEAAKAKSK